MAICKTTQRETDLVAGPRPGTLQCPECGEVMNEDTTPIDVIPADWPVRVLITEQEKAAAADLNTCGACGRSWDDAISTGMTPVPSGRCPFEYWHPGDEGETQSSTPLTDQLSREDVETALHTLAELYANSGDDTGDYLSERQQAIADRVMHAHTRLLD